MNHSAASTRVQVIREGRIVREGARIVDASASVTLVSAGGRRLVVDTGSPSECGALRTAVEKVGIILDEVDFVVNTHMHIDHCGCNDLFRRARLVAHPSERPPAGAMVVSKETELLPSVRILPTPGHTEGSITVLAQAEKRYAICGDAIPTKENYEKHVPPFINTNPRLALWSMDAILAWADVVVPGHGPPFEVMRKK